MRQNGVGHLSRARIGPADRGLGRASPGRSDPLDQADEDRAQGPITSLAACAFMAVPGMLRCRNADCGQT